MTREEAIAYGKRVMDLGLNDETQAFCELVIKVLEQESMLEKIKADIEKLANDEWNTKVGSVSQGLECALEIIEVYQEGR